MKFTTLLSGLCLGALSVLAHDPGLSSAAFEIGASETTLTVVIATPDAARLVPLDTDQNGEVTAAEFAAAEPALRDLTGRWVVPQGEATFAISIQAPELADDGVDVVLHATLDTTLPGRWLLDFPEVFTLGGQHRHYVNIIAPNGTTVLDDFVTPSMGRLALNRPAGDNAAIAGDDLPASHANFFVLGIEHILTGYDHLLFLAALIVVCHRLKSIVTIITSFTIAHSLTLAVATLGHLDLPSRWVEPLIAASIVFVGVENLLRKGEEPPARWLLTFIFGLIHGFGFAGLLRELGVGRNGGSIVRPLLEFNLGVEAGQIAIAALVIPVLRLAQNKQPKAFTQWAQPAISALVVALGGWWLVERVLG